MNNNTQTPIKTDNFDFIKLAEKPRLPLTDLELALIGNIFLYSRLAQSDDFEKDIKDCGSNLTKEQCVLVFDILTSIGGQDSEIVLKMDEWLRLESLAQNIKQPHTQGGDTD